MIEVELPDGTIAEFPDGTPPEVMKGALQKKFGATQQQAAPYPQVGVGEDMAKGFGAGVAQGAIGLPGLFGDTAQTNSNLLRGGAKMLGAPEWAQKAAGFAGRAMMGPLGFMPTSEQITKPVEAVTGPMYKAQTVPGQYAQTAGQFAPAALLGPGKVAQKAAGGIGGALTSETAGQLTKGTDAEPYARVAGGLLGGATGLTAANRLATGNAIRQTAKAAPSKVAIKGETDALYDTLREGGIQYDTKAYDAFVTKLVTDLRKSGWRPRDSDIITGDIKQLGQRMGMANDFAEIDSLRQHVGNLPGGASKQDYMRANIIREALDDFAIEGNIVSTKNIPADQVVGLTNKARELASRKIKTEILEEALERAKLQASGFENGLRIQLRALLNNKKKIRGFTEAERETMKSIVGGSSTQNILAQFGRLGISFDKMTSKASLLPSLVVGGGLTAGSLAPGMAIVGLGTAAKYGARLNAERLGNQLLGVTRAGKQAQAGLLSQRKSIRGSTVPRLGLLGAASQSGN